MYLVLKLSKILLPGVLLDLQLLLDVHLLVIVNQKVLVILENISETGESTSPPLSSPASFHPSFYLLASSS